MKTDPFLAEYRRCNEGSDKEKYDNLPNFPFLLEIEITNYCNMSCQMCPTGRGDIKRKRGFMSEETYLGIIGEIEKYKTPIRLIGFGEPLMHHEFWKFVQIAKDAGLKVHANTNGVMLREMKAPIDSIKVSVHENYPRGMKGLNALTTMNCYKYASITKEELEETGLDLSKFPFDALDRVTVYNQFKPGFKGKRPPSCTEVFTKLKINWDGTVSACCNDADNQMLVGNIHKESIKEIWLGPRMQHYRKLIVEGKNWNLPLCKDCWDLGAIS